MRVQHGVGCTFVARRTAGSNVELGSARFSKLVKLGDVLLQHELFEQVCLHLGVMIWVGHRGILVLVCDCLNIVGMGAPDLGRARLQVGHAWESFPLAGYTGPQVGQNYDMTWITGGGWE